MPTLLDAHVILHLVNGLGLMALIAIGVGAVARLGLARWAEQAIIAALFTSGAIVAMLTPAEVLPEVFIDARGVIVGLAGVLVGPIPALVATLSAALFRYLVMGGDVALGGALGTLLAGGLGIAYPYVFRCRGRVLGAWQLLRAGLFISLSVLGLFALPFEIAVAILPSILAIVPICLAASVIFGLFLQREAKLIARERNLTREAHHDPLTDLPNRRGLQHMLSRDAGRQVAEGGTRPGALILVDLDHFKRVNDVFGHEAGDEVLRRFADLVRAHLRPADVAARLGGEEFAVYLPRTMPHEARAIAERLRLAVASAGFAHDGRAFGVSASLGISAIGEPPSFAEAYRTADEALYEAKARGRNRVEMRPQPPRIAMAA